MFNTPSEAWLWAYRNIKTGDLRAIKIFKMLDAPRRKQLITVDHLAVLTFYSRKGVEPNSDFQREHAAQILWSQIMSCIEDDLVKEGFIQCTNTASMPMAVTSTFQMSRLK